MFRLMTAALSACPMASGARDRRVEARVGTGVSVKLSHDTTTTLNSHTSALLHATCHLARPIRGPALTCVGTPSGPAKFLSVTYRHGPGPAAQGKKKEVLCRTTERVRLFHAPRKSVGLAVLAATWPLAIRRRHRTASALRRSSRAKFSVPPTIQYRLRGGTIRVPDTLVR